MSTRSTTHFKGYDGETEAILYRHCDGYIACAGADLLEFLDGVRKQAQADAEGKGGGFWSTGAGRSGLASAYVVWAAENDIQAEIMRADPGDIQYRYSVARGEEQGTYKVTVDERIGYTDTWESRELMAEEVAEAQAEMEARMKAYQRKS